MNAVLYAPHRVVGLVVWWCLLSSAHAQPLPTTSAPATPTAASSATTGGVAPLDHPLPLFDVAEVQVEGNTVLPVPLIEQLLQPYAGPGKRVADLEKARALLEKTYQEAGYITVVVDLDNDAIAKGLLRLLVIEGKVERVKVTGAQYVSPAYVRHSVSELAEGTVPNFNLVQQQLMTVSKGDDRRVQPLIRPGRTPGTVETELQVADQLPLSLHVELNNRQSPDTKPLRLNTTLRYDNLFQKDHSVSLNVVTAPQSTAQAMVGVLSYTMPAGAGATWALYAVKSNSQVEPVGAAMVMGKGGIVGLRHIQSMPAVNDLTHSFTWGFDYKDFRERIGSGPDSPTTPLVYLPLSLAYNANVTGERSQDQYALTMALASREVFKRDVNCPGYTTPVNQFACKNPSADASFVTLRFDWHHLQDVGGKWHGLVRLAGQASGQPLVSNEQYALGGADTVRGYLEAEASGDRALLATLELQSPNWAAGKQWKWLQEMQTLAFIDAGRVYISDPASGVPPHTSLLSAGLGLRAKTGKVMNTDLMVAWPFKQASHYTHLNQARLLVRMAWQF